MGDVISPGDGGRRVLSGARGNESPVTSVFMDMDRLVSVW